MKQPGVHICQQSLYSRDSLDFLGNVLRPDALEENPLKFFMASLAFALSLAAAEPDLSLLACHIQSRVVSSSTAAIWIDEYEFK